MRSLKDAIGVIPGERVSLVSDTQSVTFTRLLTYVKETENNSKLKLLIGSKVAIVSLDQLSFIKILVALDGIVDSMLFLPENLSCIEKSKFYKEVGIQYEVSWDDDKIAAVKVHLAESNLKSNSISTEWIIPTSGTTNTPKLVIHSLSSLVSTTKKDISRGENYSWGLVYDIKRFAGIQVFLQSLLSGATLIIADQTSISNKLLFLTKYKCNSLSATPSFWRKFMMAQTQSEIQLKVITLGGEIADSSILQALRKRFPQSRISHIYASTEAGVGFSVGDCRAGFPLAYLTKGIKGVSLKIGKEGTLLIKSNNVSKRYASENALDLCEGFVNSGDLVKVEGNRVYFLGRDSGAINVGGNKVQPEEVEATILGSGLVLDVLVFGKKNAILGNIVCANLVVSGNKQQQDRIKSELLSFCRNKLDAFKVPGVVKFVDSIELNSTGKLKRG